MATADNEKLYDIHMISKTFYRLLPLQVLIVVINSLNSIIDGIIASNMIGPIAMAVTGLCIPFLKVIDAVNAVMTGGSQIICGQSLGANMLKKTRSVFTVDVLFTLAFAVVFGGIFFVIFPGPIAGLMQAEGELRTGFVQYVRGMSIGVFPMMMAAQLSGFLQLEQQEKRSYIAIIAMMVSNVALDISFIKFLDMGMFGLGLATGISNWICLLILCPYYFSKKAVIRLELKAMDVKDLLQIWKMGYSGALVQACLVIRGLIINALIINNIGDAGMSAYSAINSFGGVFFATAAACGSATRLLVSVYFGEKDAVSLKETMKVALLKGSGIVLAVNLVIACCSYPLTCVFFRPSAGAVFDMTRLGFIMFALSMPFSSICQSLVGYNQCLGRMKIVSILSVFDGAIGMCVTALILTPTLGMTGIWISQLANGFITMSVAFIYACISKKGLPGNFGELIALPGNISKGIHLDISIHDIEKVVNSSIGITKFCEKHDVAPVKGLCASLCVEEMAGNIVEHGFEKERNHNIDVRVFIEEGGVVIRIKDDCIPFNPEEASKLFDPEDRTHNIGLQMVNSMVNEMSYQRILGLNVVTMKL